MSNFDTLVTLDALRAAVTGLDGFEEGSREQALYVLRGLRPVVEALVADANAKVGKPNPSAVETVAAQMRASANYRA